MSCKQNLVNISQEVVVRSIGLPLGVSWTPLGSFWNCLGSLWVASWNSLGSLEVPLGPRSPKDLQNGAPGYQNDKTFDKKRTTFFKKCNRIVLQSCSLQRPSQRATQANSSKFVPELLFKAVPCNAFRKGKH